MALFLDSWLAELVVVLSSAVLALYLWLDRGFKYWKNKGVPYEQPSFPFGNTAQSMLGRRSIGLVTQDIYEKWKGERFVGFYSLRRPILLVRDANIVRQMLVKDFATFHDRGFYVDEEEPLLRHLFFLPGYKWHQLRTKLSPTFTSGKLKGMFQTMQDCGCEMVEVLTKLAERGEIVQTNDLVARFFTDVIVSVGFGVESHCQRDPNAEFRKWGRKVFDPDLRTTLAFLLSMINPSVANILRIKGGVTEISKYFQKMVADTVSFREKNNTSRKDFLDLLIQLKNKGFVDDEKLQNGQSAEDNKLPMDDLAAQAFVFFIAGFETSTTTMSFTLHELALHQDIQRKLQQEIDSALKEHGGKISYDAIASMSYLDQVVSETLRKYPPLPILNRECNQDYKIPDSDVVLEKGTSILISLLGLQNDPEHFPDPERYDPERFSEAEKAKRHSYSYLPFGEGPRICIGMRLGLLQTKVGLVNVLSNFKVRPTQKTVHQLPYNGRTVLLTTNSGIQLRFDKRA